MPERGRPLVSAQSVDEQSIEIVLEGDLDVASAGELVSAVEQLQPLSARVVLDLGSVTFIDSAGLRGLLTVRERVLAETGQPLVLRAVSSEQLTLLEMCGLLDAFDLEPSGA